MAPVGSIRSRLPGGSVETLKAYTVYKGNSQLLIDEAIAYDFGMQMAHRSLDEQPTCKVNEPNEQERGNCWTTCGMSNETILRLTKKLMRVSSTRSW